MLIGDATWTQWIEWSECNTAVCNIEGTRNRTRLCFVLNPNVQANCNGGDSIQLQKCTKPCLGKFYYILSREILNPTEHKVLGMGLVCNIYNIWKDVSLSRKKWVNFDSKVALEE